MKIPAFLVATAALISAAIGLTFSASPADASAYPTSCATSVSPYHGGTSRTVYSQHGIAVRQYSKPGVAPLFTASGDITNAMPEPIWHTDVTSRSSLASLVNASRALVGVNGDFFRINSNGAPYGPQVAAGHAVKGLAYGQSAIITTTSGRLTYGKCGWASPSPTSGTPSPLPGLTTHKHGRPASTCTRTAGASTSRSPDRPAST